MWILALLLAFGAVAWIERQSAIAPSAEIVYTSDFLQVAPLRELDASEREWAQTAWAYFERGTDAETGLVNSVDGFASASMWDEGSYLLALIAARRLGLITETQFDARLAKALTSLSQLPLTSIGLPNKTYDVHKLAMADYQNAPSLGGTGVSAIDVARLVVPLQVIVWHHPKHSQLARAVIARWNLEALAKDGSLSGWVMEQAGARIVQEGRLGYEQYAAKALAPLNLDVAIAADWRSHLRWVKVGNIQVPGDTREGLAFDAVVSEPYMLLGLEFGWSRTAREMAWRVYSAQEDRFRATGIDTAASEDHLDQAPYFAYNSLYVHGKPWTAVSVQGAELPELRTISTKAAFAWHALLRTPYTAQLIKKVAALNVPGKGWYAGMYEQDGRLNRSINCNTNAVVLESLAYIAGGPLGGVK
jgi:hypothetical protein